MDWFVHGETEEQKVAVETKVSQVRAGSGAGRDRDGLDSNGLPLAGATFTLVAGSGGSVVLSTMYIEDGRDDDCADGTKGPIKGKRWGKDTWIITPTGEVFEAR